VTPVLCAPISDLPELERVARRTPLEQGVLKDLKDGDELVITGGDPLLEAQETSLVKVVRL
jgi:hypothetical protein